MSCTLHAVVYCNQKNKILAERFLGLQVRIFPRQNFEIEIAVHDSIGYRYQCCRVLQPKKQNFGREIFYLQLGDFPLPKFWNWNCSTRQHRIMCSLPYLPLKIWISKKMTKSVPLKIWYQKKTSLSLSLLLCSVVPKCLKCLTFKLFAGRENEIK